MEPERTNTAEYKNTTTFMAYLQWRKKIKEVQNMALLNKTLIKILFFSMFMSACSPNWHYFLQTGTASSDGSINSKFTNTKGLSINCIDTFNWNSCHSLRIDILIVKIEPQYSGQSCATIDIGSNKICLDDLWDSFIKEIRLDDTNRLYWLAHRVCSIKAANRKYICIEFVNSLPLNHQPFFTLLIDYSDTGRLESYPLPPLVGASPNLFGDFNMDSYLDYAIVNDSAKRIEFYTFKNNKTIKNNNVFLKIKETKCKMCFYPKWTITKIQKNAIWWYQNPNRFSVKAK